MQLAKAKESDQSYQEAEQAYEQAEDWENVIRLNLSFCNDPQKAKNILRTRCQNVNCANMLSAYAIKKGEH